MISQLSHKHLILNYGVCVCGEESKSTFLSAFLAASHVLTLRCAVIRLNSTHIPTNIKSLGHYGIMMPRVYHASQ